MLNKYIHCKDNSPEFDSKETFNFGQKKNETFGDVLENDIVYTLFVINKARFIKKENDQMMRFKRFAKFHLSKPLSNS